MNCGTAVPSWEMTFSDPSGSCSGLYLVHCEWGDDWLLVLCGSGFAISTALLQAATTFFSPAVFTGHLWSARIISAQGIHRQQQPPPPLKTAFKLFDMLRGGFGIHLHFEFTCTALKPLLKFYPSVWLIWNAAWMLVLKSPLVDFKISQMWNLLLHKAANTVLCFSSLCPSRLPFHPLCWG